MKIASVYGLIFILSVIFVSCTDRYETINEQFVLINKNDLRDDTLIEDAVTHRYFSRVKKNGSFGRVVKLNLTKNQVGQEFHIIFKGKIRTNYPQSNSTISVATYDRDDRQIDWLTVFLKPYYTSVNEWSYFEDSVRIEHNKAGRKLTSISCFVFLPNGTDEHFDLDTLHVAFKQKM